MSASRVRRLWHLVQYFELRSCNNQAKSFQTSARHCLSNEQDAIPQILKPTSAPPITKAKRISKAMQAYIDRAKQHDELIEQETAEYEIGKRHLANIMGVDPSTFDQESIDKAIEYLLPSGLFDKKAKPMMKHPLEIFPSRKAAQFGMDGRPFHYLFYTGKPQFYQIMHETALLLDELNRHQDAMIAKGFREAPAHEQWTGKGSEWISAKTLENRLVEPVSENEHFQFVTLLNRVLTHEYSNRAQGYLMKFRQELLTQDISQIIPQPIEAENGRRYIESHGRKKRTDATVQVWENGSGRVTINGQHDILYFGTVQDREQVMFPLQLAGKLGEMDVVITVDEGGPSTQSGAIRLALARALCSFVDAATVEKFRLAGLLQEDRRFKERKKFGQEKARKKWTWKKR